MSDVINGVPRELLERVCARPWSHSENHKLAMMELSALLTAQPQASRCPDCGYLTSQREHLGCLRKAVSDLDAATGGQPQASAEQSAPAGAGRDGLPLVIAGAIFDFAGFLTTREGVIEVGATANASPVADLIQEWAELRGLSLADAAVLSWQDLLAAWQRTQSAPLFGGDERQHIICVCPDCLAEAQRTQSAGVPDVSAMARVLSDRSADACNIDRTDNWAMYGQEYIEDVQAMLAAPAQPAALAYKDDPRSPSELSLAGCNCVRFGKGNPHWPCKIHPAQPAAQELEK